MNQEIMKRGRKKNRKKKNLDQDGVTAEKLELLHSLRVKRNHRVIIVDSLIHYQSIGCLFPLQNRRTKIPLRTLTAHHKHDKRKEKPIKIIRTHKVSTRAHYKKQKKNNCIRLKILIYADITINKYWQKSDHA